MRILIADDHAIVRKGIVELLMSQFRDADIHEAMNGEEVLQKIKENIWDLIILDISMPRKTGIETVKQIRAAGIKAPILMLSMHSENQYAIRSITAGASGFVNKESAMEELISAVHEVLSGGKYISDAVREKLSLSLLENKDKSPVELLSDRELQVLQMIASGKSITDIAEEIGLSLTTISTFRARILEKLSLNNNAELARFAIDHGLTQ